MILPASPISSNQFSYDGHKKMFVAEASDFKQDSRFDRPIYDDAADRGFAIKSERTGHVVIFSENETIRDREGDAQVFVYRPIPEELRKNPFLRDLSVHILND